MSVLAASARARQMALPPDRRQADAQACDHRARDRNRCSDGGRLTLEQQLARVWEGLHVAGAAACPICGSHMTAHGYAGRCEDCGTTLS